MRHLCGDPPFNLVRSEARNLLHTIQYEVTVFTINSALYRYARVRQKIRPVPNFQRFKKVNWVPLGRPFREYLLALLSVIDRIKDGVYSRTNAELSSRNIYWIISYSRICYGPAA
jgi:hypothetical protein